MCWKELEECGSTRQRNSLLVEAFKIVTEIVVFQQLPVRPNKRVWKTAKAMFADVQMESSFSSHSPFGLICQWSRMMDELVRYDELTNAMQIAVESLNFMLLAVNEKQHFQAVYIYNITLDLLKHRLESTKE